MKARVLVVVNVLAFVATFKVMTIMTTWLSSATDWQPLSAIAIIVGLAVLWSYLIPWTVSEFQLDWRKRYASKVESNRDTGTGSAGGNAVDDRVRQNRSGACGVGSGPGGESEGSAGLHTQDGMGILQQVRNPSSRVSNIRPDSDLDEGPPRGR